MSASGRFLTRSRIVLAALGTTPGRARPEGEPKRVLVAHHPQMIGDTLLLSPLFAKLRHAYPRCEIVIATSAATQPLYATRPWGVEALRYDPREAATFRAFRKDGGYGLAIVPGDNRYGWFARGAGARWVVGFGGDRPAYKNLLIDELHDSPATPGMWGELASGLVPGGDPPPYTTAQWPAPPFAPFERPKAPYCAIQLGASTPLKLWPEERWRALAEELEHRGLAVVWTGAAADAATVARVDPQAKRTSFAGRLDLAQLWHLLAGARLLVTPDTGVAHLGRIVGVPTVTLFGPGSAVVAGAGRFWRDSPWRAVSVDPFACRDQRTLFKRRVEWVRRCARSTRECAEPRCMQAITLEAVRAAIGELVPELR